MSREETQAQAQSLIDSRGFEQPAMFIGRDDSFTYLLEWLDDDSLTSVAHFGNDEYEIFKYDRNNNREIAFIATHDRERVIRFLELEGIPKSFGDVGHS